MRRACILVLLLVACEPPVSHELECTRSYQGTNENGVMSACAAEEWIAWVCNDPDYRVSADCEAVDRASVVEISTTCDLRYSPECAEWQ